jgi:ubiquinone/menaquinone biosynthesis C-methylase UbiE
MDWNQAYEKGDFKNWDFGSASPELVSFLAVLGLPAPGSRALDIGCGGGWDSIFLAQCGFAVTGVDVSPKALSLAARRAKKAGVSIRFRTGDARNLPVEDLSIDFANDRGCFHVIPREERHRYAEEIRRVLKPGGQLLLRGCREMSPEMEESMRRSSIPMSPITEEVLDRLFPAERLFRGPVLPIRLTGEDRPEGLPAHIVLITKR